MREQRISKIVDVLLVKTTIHIDECYKIAEAVADAIKPVDPVISRVVDQIEQRSNVGVKKYNTTLAGNPLNLFQWMEHLKQELMDATNYVQCVQDGISQDQS